MTFEIPRRFREPSALVALKRIDQRLRALAARWDGLCGSLVLGPTGCGKSLTAATAGRRVAIANSSETWVRWVRADYLSRLLSERGASDQVETLVRARVLVLDELGYERWPELVLEVIGSRYDRGLPTMVTSGLKLAKVLDRYGDATVRKVTETGNGGVTDCWVSLEDPTQDRYQ